MQTFDWQVQPAAWQWLEALIDRCLDRCEPARSLEQRMAEQTGTRLIDWLDHVVIDAGDPAASPLAAIGYVPDPALGPGGHAHPGAVLPMVRSIEGAPLTLAIKVERVDDFQRVHGVAASPDGEPMGPLRTLTFYDEADARLIAVERHGYRGFAPPSVDAGHAERVEQVAGLFGGRPRDLDDLDAAFDGLDALLDRAEATGLAAAAITELFFAAERDFWMTRNTAARVQHARQASLGVGWANHDHHTYRSSRPAFHRLVAVWERLGLRLRERFYAGAEAGWGAQVMEHADTGIVTFSDVDMSPDELRGDFAHEPMEARAKLGTVGLWCGLHGESLFEAGMHHLECQFDFDALREQLEREHGVGMMAPFTNFPHLRQAFTDGERWPVDPDRIDRLHRAGHIDDAQADRFRRDGAIGSHLENLERNEGFKGFNQTGVSDIIGRTDPRHAPATA
jgi:hypothetical protein